MLAEEASDLIRGREPLPPLEVPSYIAPNLGNQAAVREGHPPPNSAVNAASLAFSSHSSPGSGQK
jgi:hypothetical protein